jgi:hypothetical protein
LGPRTWVEYGLDRRGGDVIWGTGGCENKV